MAKQRVSVLLLGLLIPLLVAVGCGGNFDANLATFNARATQLAGGGDGGGGDVTAPAETPTPTEPPNYHDLTTDPNALLVSAWGQVYGLSSGSTFTIVATQRQVGDFIVETLQLGGLQDTIQGGTASIGVGQIRLDVAIHDLDGVYGGGTVTFQPTLDALGRIKINPQGEQFGNLNLPSNLRASLGDAVHTALAGARNDSLSRVTLQELSLENEVMRASGVVR